MPDPRAHVIEDPPLGRRRDPRVVVPATAMLLDDSEQLLGRCVVDNLSSGGAYVVGEVDVAPGTLVTFVLEPAGAPAVSLTARVVRRSDDDERVGLGLAFVVATVDAERALERTVRRAMAAREPHLVIIASRNEARVEQVSDQVAQLGHYPVAVATPLELELLLADLGELTEAVVIDPHTRSPFSMARHLAKHHPLIRRAILRTDEPRGEATADAIGGVPVTAIDFPATAVHVAFVLDHGARW